MEASHVIFEIQVDQTITNQATEPLPKMRVLYIVNKYVK